MTGTLAPVAVSTPRFRFAPSPTGFLHVGNARAALFNWYTRPIYRPQENWFLSLNPRILEGASDDMLVLLGYRTEGFGKVNGRSPR